MSDQLYRGAITPDHRADWLNARPPAPVWTENVSCPSSGNARLLPVYAGALSATASKLVYRKAKSGEHSYAKGTRWETLTGAAYVDQDTLSVAGTNVLQSGNTTHLGQPCNFITWPAATHDYASTYVADLHGASIAVGQKYLARLELAFSRNLVSTETVQLFVRGAANVANRLFNAADSLQSGRFHPVIVDEGLIAAAGAGTDTIYYSAAGTFASPLTIYFRRRMLFDASGLDASECVPDFIDPAVDYGFGAVGVKWAPTKCGNTVAANGVIIPGTGAALPEPMGMLWHPGVTGLASDSPPASGTNVTVTDASGAVAGLPAKRLTASGGGSLTHSVSISASTTTGARELSILVAKPAAGGAKPNLRHLNATFFCHVTPTDDWTALVVVDANSKVLSSRIKNLGGDMYWIALAVTTNNEATPSDFIYIYDSAGSSAYVAAGEYIDVAALNSFNKIYSGTPVLSSGGATVRLQDQPRTSLPVIGAGAYTVFVDFTIMKLPASGNFPFLFYANGDVGGSSDQIYISPSGLYAYSAPSSVGQVIAVGRHKVVMRRDVSGNIQMFVDNSNVGGFVLPPLNATGVPYVGGIGRGSYHEDIVVHDAWIDYSALTDEDCKRVTRL